MKFSITTPRQDMTRDRALANVKLSCQRFLRNTTSGVEIADLLDSSRCKFRLGSVGPAQNATPRYCSARCLPVLRNLICHVRGRSSEKQVIWPNTRRVVAMMADKSTVWDRTVVQFPRQAMCAAIVGLTAQADDPVAVLVPKPRPQPATLRTLHLCPEPSGYRNTGAHLMNCIRLRAAPSNLGEDG